MLSITPPLWLSTEMPPAGTEGSRMPNEVAKPRGRLITPRPLGPMKRIPQRAATSLTRAASARPSSPNSVKPPDSTTTRRTPLRPHSSMISGTAEAGARRTARSTWSGMSSTEW